MNEALEYLERLIRKFEGLKLKAYFCPAGVLTCGWGTTGQDIKLDTKWTREYADERMRSDAKKFIRAVLRYSPSLASNPPALAAAADFAYNLGAGRYRVSTLRKKLEAGDWGSAKVELMKWTRGGGKVLPGLVARRRAECELLG
jgi:lysozyme